MTSQDLVASGVGGVFFGIGKKGVVECTGRMNELTSTENWRWTKSYVRKTFRCLAASWSVPCYRYKKESYYDEY